MIFILHSLLIFITCYHGYVNSTDPSTTDSSILVDDKPLTGNESVHWL